MRNEFQERGATHLQASPPKKVTAVDVATAMVLTGKFALVAPAETVTPEGTLAAGELLLERVTCTPPAGAGPLSVTVPVEEFPPVTVAGFRVVEESERVGGGEDCSKIKTAGLGSLSETATSFEAVII